MPNVPTAKEIFAEFKNYQNPPVTADIEIVWVISGHANFDGTQATITYALDTLNGFFIGEDRERVEKGIELVKEITAKRLGKKVSEITIGDIKEHGPIFFYNGTFRQNEVLRNVSTDVFGLPREKVVIAEITPVKDPTPQQANTYTQFDKFPQNLLRSLAESQGKMAVVTSRYHLPRVMRQVAPTIVRDQPLWEKARLDFFSADELATGPDKSKKHKNAALILRLLKSEAKKIETYIRKGDLSPEPEKDA